MVLVLEADMNDERTGPERGRDSSSGAEKKVAKLEQELRSLYETYGGGSMPEEMRALAESLERRRAELAAAKKPGDSSPASD